MLSESDIINKKIVTTKNFSLKNHHCFVSTILPLSKIEHNAYSYYLKFPEVLGKTSTKNKNKRLIKECRNFDVRHIIMGKLERYDSVIQNLLKGIENKKKKRIETLLKKKKVDEESLKKKTKKYKEIIREREVIINLIQKYFDNKEEWDEFREILKINLDKKQVKKYKDLCKKYNTLVKNLYNLKRKRSVKNTKRKKVKKSGA